MAKTSIEELASAARLLALPADTPLKKVTMQLLLRVEIMEHFMEEIYEKTRLLEVQHPTYEKLREIREMAIFGGDIWEKYFNAGDYECPQSR